MADDIVTWARVEPHAATTDIDVGLAAEIADPVWLLARQRQLGEFTGDDGGSPVGVQVRASYSRVSRYRPGPLQAGEDGSAKAVDYKPERVPLESMVEREPLDEARAWRARLTGGQTFERRLKKANLAGAIPPLRAAFRFVPDTRGAARGAQEQRYEALFSDGMIDGVLLRRALPGGVPDAIAQASGNAARFRTEIAAWSQWFDDMMAVGSGDPAAPSWQKQTIEYAFAVSGPAPAADGEEVVLAAAEYDGRGLDWYHLDVVPGATLNGAAAGATVDRGVVSRRLLPKRVTFPGMPVDRFFEMEDGCINLGTVDAGPTDLARLLVTEYATIYSPDWFVVPLELPIGCLARVDAIVVRDTFNVLTLVGTPQTQAEDRAGRQFQLDVAGDPEADVPLLFVPPAVLYGQQSGALEDVLLQRDEQANLVWAIERQTLGAAGRPIGANFAPLAAMRDASEFQADLIYQVATVVPSHWSPYVAVPVAGTPGERLMLQRARLLDTPSGTTRTAVGQIARGMDRLPEEEVTRAGVRLRLIDQLVRWIDGSTHVWRGRQKTPGLGESDARLFFDYTARRLR